MVEKQIPQGTHMTVRKCLILTYAFLESPLVSTPWNFEGTDSYSMPIVFLIGPSQIMQTQINFCKSGVVAVIRFLVFTRGIYFQTRLVQLASVNQRHLG